ncbi:arginyl-tRNA synthetase [Pleomassaria siparia CBS 279.74]|uniref:arginine--tRNA ligase n=1 Tax=Pleomassaria siparia CBS 279.74 TaxID=1314801 RepID=A0A6G1K3N2_9PLEO|nr:arginyl-tRNA synthetase [Pleomassaria siparia CBS 279.74]
MTTLTIPELETALEKLELSIPIPQFAASDVLNRPLDLVRAYLADILSSLVDADRTAAYNSTSLSNDPLHGDITVVLPKLYPGAKFGELANDLIKKFPHCPLFGLPWADGIHLRICVTPQTLPRLLLPYIYDRKESYGGDSTLGLKNAANPAEGRQRLLVEFSSPNIASDFEGKHLRSTIIGSFVSTLHEHMGWDVTRLNYFGDWGKDMALLGVGWEKFGSEEAFQADPTTHLLDVYHKIQEIFLPEQVASKKARDEAKKKAKEEVDDTAEIESKGLFAERNEFFKRMEDGDDTALTLYKRIRDVNIDNYTKLYARMGITFDENSGESQVKQETMAEIEQLLKDKELCEESGGAWIVHMQKLGARAGTAVIRNRAGTSTYLLRYLAAVLERWRKHAFDKMIFVAADRNEHFSKLIMILEDLYGAELKGKLHHVQFNDKSQMSDKLGGHGHQPHEILDQIEKSMSGALKADETRADLLGNPEDTAKVVGITGLLMQELSTKQTGNHVFDLDAMATFKPGTGPDLQYWYARLCSILQGESIAEDLGSEEYGLLDDEEQTSLLLVLGQYPDVTQAAFEKLESTPITTYLASVVEHLSYCFDDEDDDEDNEGAEESKQKGDNQKQAAAVEDTVGDLTAEDGQSDEVVEVEIQATKITPAQAALYEATRTVLENGMKILGLTPIALSHQTRADTPVAE